MLDECEAANRDQPITFFEVTTAAAFLAFARTPADALLLESGLGGRLDATNVVERPALSVITPVSIDHTQYLGEELGMIAAEKAGILKSGVGAVVGAQRPEAADVIDARAAALGIPLVRHGGDYRGDVSGDGMRYVERDEALALPRPALLGPHQVDNAALAVACLRRLEGFDVGVDDIAEGLRTTRWPARMQRLRRGPLVERLPRGWELWLDCGHNAAAGEALARTVGDWGDRPLHLVVGMLGTKDPEAMLRPLAATAADVTCVAIPGESASLSAVELAAAAGAAGLAAVTAEDVGAAVDDIAAKAAAPARILICGSHYLAGSILADHG